MKQTITFLRNTWGVFLTRADRYPFFTRITSKRFWGFIASTMLVIGVLWSLQLSFRQIPRLQNNLNQSIQTVPEHFPTDTTVAWNGESLTVTPEQIILVPYPEWVEQEYQTKEFAGVIATNPELEKPESVLAEVTATQLIAHNPGFANQYALAPILGSESFSVTSENIGSYLTNAEGYIAETVQIMKIASMLISPVYATLLIFGHLISNGLLTMFLLKLQFRRSSWQTAFRFSLVLVCLSLVIEQFALLVVPDFAISADILYFILFVYIVLANRNNFTR